jgi:hypothetical protein
MKECGDLMQTVFMRLLSKLGVNRNMHRDWVFAHQDFQGLGMPNVYLEQTITQLNSIMAQTDGHTHVSYSLNACYEKLLLELGTSGSLFEKDFASQGHLAMDCWLKSAWKGCSIYGIDIALPHASQLKRQREQDELLMDLFLRQGPTDAYAKALNRVRRHLHVYALADISTGDGRSIQTRFT